MTAKRFLLGVLLAGAFAWSGGASAQSPSSPPRPLSAGEGLLPPGTAAPTSGGTGTPLLGTAPYLNPGDAQPTMTLTGPRGGVGATGQLPPGSVESPWVGGSRVGADCCGPVGANGPVTYELYTRTGPTFILGGGSELSGASRFGWMVQGGGRSLLMNQAADGAWVLDIGVSYAYNGASDRVFDVFARQPKNPQTGQLLGPDQLQPFRLRGFTRTGFNYAVGYDWFLNGPGFLGYEQAWNSRFGVDIGGQWGTARVDLIPTADVDNYFRRYSVAHGVQLGVHWNAEVPMGSWILFSGVRAQYGFHWSNVIPPQDGNFQDASFLLTVGVRF